MSFLQHNRLLNPIIVSNRHTYYQHILLSHSTIASCQHTYYQSLQSTHPINPHHYILNEHTLSTHPINTPYQPIEIPLSIISPLHFHPNVLVAAKKSQAEKAYAKWLKLQKRNKYISLKDGSKHVVPPAVTTTHFSPWSRGIVSTACCYAPLPPPHFLSIS